jgi:TRAP transporter 4TM/12TM fusion protein
MAAIRVGWWRLCAWALPVFVLVEVTYPRLTPQSELALFAMGGLTLAFLSGEAASRWRGIADLSLAVTTWIVGLFMVVQSEAPFVSLWLRGHPLGDRAGAETGLDLAIAALGVVVTLEAARRTVGWALPALSLAFLAYASFGSWLPAWALPHRGYGGGRIVAQAFLHGQGVFGVALYVMFTYVFLFVVLGSMLEATGATRYVLEASRRLLGRTEGAPAKIAVLASGLLGSLSGSAVANTATTGTFTIPMMRDAGLRREVAGGIEAAASSGGALVPPVMGAGAYMMLELVDPPVTYLQIVRAALLPAVLYYVAIFLTVHFSVRGLSTPGDDAEPAAGGASWRRWEGLVLGGALAALVALLLAGYSVIRAVSAAVVVVALLAALNRRTRLGAQGWRNVVIGAARASAPLVAAAASVGIVVGMVTLTGAGTRLPGLILPLAQEHLFGALLLLMGSSIVLGMGLPSAVCYLLLATLVGPVLGRLGVVPLAAHFFIFYFGLMSMVTPPVALAAYTASSIAGSRFMPTSWQAFRFALVGFVLPFLFVYRPELLLLGPDGELPGWSAVALALVPVLVGIVPLAAGLAGWLGGRLSLPLRIALVASGLLLLVPSRGEEPALTEWQALGALLGVGTVLWVWRKRRS